MNIRFTKKSYNDYLKLPLSYKKIVDRTLERFESGIPVDIKPIKGTSDTFRVRIGRYRMLFVTIKPDMLIIKIRKRDDVY